MGAWAWQHRETSCFSEGGIGLRDGAFSLASRAGEAPIPNHHPSPICPSGYVGLGVGADGTC